MTTTADRLKAAHEDAQRAKGAEMTAAAWRERAEAAEKRLANVEASRDALKVLIGSLEDDNAALRRDVLKLRAVAVPVRGRVK